MMSQISFYRSYDLTNTNNVCSDYIYKYLCTWNPIYIANLLLCVKLNLNKCSINIVVHDKYFSTIAVNVANRLENYAKLKCNIFFQNIDTKSNILRNLNLKIYCRKLFLSYF